MDTSPSAPAPAPFATAAALSEFLAPPAAYLAAQGPDAASDRLVVGTAVVVARRPRGAATATAAAAARPRLLLVQRSRHDFGGGCWETPGGLCEAGRDGSVLAAAARELREEAGLAARRFAGRVATPHAWVDGAARWRKLTFLVEVYGGGGGEAGTEEEEEEQEDDGDERAGALPVVRLDPDEHEDYVWATELEVRDGRAGARVFTWISEDQRTVVLDAFALARRLEEEEKGEIVRGGGDGQGHANTDASS